MKKTNAILLLLAMLMLAPGASALSTIVTLNVTSMSLLVDNDVQGPLVMSVGQIFFNTVHTNSPGTLAANTGGSSAMYANSPDELQIGLVNSCPTGTDIYTQTWYNSPTNYIELELGGPAIELKDSLNSGTNAQFVIESADLPASYFVYITDFLTTGQESYHSGGNIYRTAGLLTNGQHHWCFPST